MYRLEDQRHLHSLPRDIVRRTFVPESQGCIIPVIIMIIMIILYTLAVGTTISTSTIVPPGAGTGTGVQITIFVILTQPDSATILAVTFACS